MAHTLTDIEKKSARAGLLLIIIAALTLEATSIVQYFYSQKGIKEEASMRAESQLETTKVRIMDIINQAEAAVRNSVWIAQWCLEVPDSMGRVTQRIVHDNPVVVGSTVAFVPGYDKRHELFAPYCYRESGTGEIKLKSLATTQYDYPSQEWFTKPIELDTGYWSEPYIDEGGGEMLMTTYSLPLRDSKGNVAAVITADISLDWLNELVGNISVYPNAYSVLLSRSGQIMVCPVETLVMNTSIQDLQRNSLAGNETFNDISHSMLSGHYGNRRIKHQGVTSQVYFAPVERTGWSMSIVIPENEIFAGIRRIGVIVKLLQILGIVMLILLLRSVAKRQYKYKMLNEQKERIEGELQIASAIQMAMIPKIYPPYPEREDIDVFGQLTPAKEVGGDLFDFYIREEKLFFCIGDVSGKGIPASLYMMVTRALFRTISTHESSPDKIMSNLNDIMSQDNESNMFVTLFLGVLDLPTGRLHYCNAGHDAPILIGNTGAGMLPVDSNLPVGVMPEWKYSLQESVIDPDTCIFLYTDGLTEAEDIEHRQYGMTRIRELTQQLQQNGTFSPTVIINSMTDAVHLFVGNADQSDDLTMLAIQYTLHQKDFKFQRSLTLTNDIKRIPRLNAFIDDVCNANGIDMSESMQINLALEEAVSNVINYAYPTGTKGDITIEAKSNGEKMFFIISDTGTPFDPTARPAVDTTLSAEDREIGGLGIHLIRKIMDHINYERTDGHNVFTLIKKLNK
ncbi:MAG: SpoIIE family protein phosphatase [Bacteroidaceae bacterium]|nr:SpoIIE family protein phosphatase [Bacteroidaceae bacterium]